MKEYKLIIEGSNPREQSLGRHFSEREALLHALRVIDPSVSTLDYLTDDMVARPRLRGLKPGWYVRHDFGPDTYCGDSSSLDNVLLYLASESGGVRGQPTAVRLVTA